MTRRRKLTANGQRIVRETDACTVPDTIDALPARQGAVQLASEQMAP